MTQSREFDPQGRFIRRYLPQLARLDDEQIHAPWEPGRSSSRRPASTLGRDYPRPIVDHDEAREKTLRRATRVVARSAEGRRGLTPAQASARGCAV